MTRTPIGRRWSILATLSLLLIGGFALGSGLAAPVAEAGVLAQDGTAVAISPAAVSLNCDETATVDIKIFDVEGLFGVDLKVSYDPNVVEVVDANITSPGTQIQQGDMPDVSSGQGMIQVNSVDEASGTISYAAVRLNPALPQSGNGTIATITFRGKASGTSPVNLSSVILADHTARAIPAELSNGEITVTCVGPGPTSTTPPGQPTATPEPGGNGDDKPCKYIVRKGDTLYAIARRFNVTVAALMAANKIMHPDLVYVGQWLLIPGCMGDGGHDGGDGDDGECYPHIVKPGETVYGIAAQSGDSPTGIATRNKVVNSDLIYAGQTLTVCPAGGVDPGDPSPKCQATHIVKPGDNLFRIALSYGSTVSAISAASGLANANLIYVGQTICIP